MATVFTIAREIMRATDAEHQREHGGSAVVATSAPHKRDATAAPDWISGAKTVWWHQIDDENDEAYEVKDVSGWHATKDLRAARLHLMNNRATEGVAALEKLRGDLLLYARDAA